MGKIYSLFCLIVLVGCSRATGVPAPETGYHLLEGHGNTGHIKIKLPESLTKVEDLDFNEDDSIDVVLDWLIEKQIEFSEHHFFVDPVNPQFNISVFSGRRVNISDEEPNVTIFTVPAVPLRQVFPAETENQKIVQDVQGKKYKDKTYYKRKFKTVRDEQTHYQTFYHIITIFQSASVIINSDADVDLDEYILNYEVFPKKK